MDGSNISVNVMPVSVIFPSERDHVVGFSCELGSVTLLCRVFATGNIATGKEHRHWEHRHWETGHLKQKKQT